MKTGENSINLHGLSVRQAALFFGLPEFSVFARIQSGAFISTRFPSGIVAIPIAEAERVSKRSVIESQLVDHATEAPSDNILGITKDSGITIKRKGEELNYVVPDHFRRFTASEIEGYRTALASIWEQYSELIDIRKQLETGPIISSSSLELNSKIEGWTVRSSLLKSNQSEILLCQKNDEFAIIERFKEDSRYAKAHGQTEILMEGGDDRELVAAFEANARHTLEFMASNQVATAQKVIWEQFPDNRPAQLVAAISERCRLAAVPGERVVLERAEGNSQNPSIKI